jgi:hypothetical protein
MPVSSRATNYFLYFFLNSYNEIAEFYEKEKENSKHLRQYGVPLDKLQWWDDYYGPHYYKINRNGKVTLLWSGNMMEGGFPYLKKIPHNILDLSDLMYLDLMCEVKKEAIPKAFYTTDKFEVELIYADEWRANAWSMKNWRENKPIIQCNHTAFEIADEYNGGIDLDNFFELKIYRKELRDEIKKGRQFLFEGAFKIE